MFIGGAEIPTDFRGELKPTNAPVTETTPPPEETPSVPETDKPEENRNTDNDVPIKAEDETAKGVDAHFKKIFALLFAIAYIVCITDIKLPKFAAINVFEIKTIQIIVVNISFTTIFTTFESKMIKTYKRL